MTLRCQASTLVPLQLVANVNGEVVLVQHLVCQVFVLPVYDMRPAELAKVEVHTRRRDILAVECPCCGWKKRSYGKERQQ
jgi:hypothetical protein